MRLEVYRDSREGMELVGAFASTDFGIRFFYDVRYVQRGEEKGEFGISESMPLDFGCYEPQEYAPFFQGLLPKALCSPIWPSVTKCPAMIFLPSSRSSDARALAPSRSLPRDRD